MSYDLSCNYNYFHMIDWNAPRQKFLTRRTPIDQKLNLRKWRNWLFFENKNLNFESVAGISVRNFDRKFRQHNGDPLCPKCSDTRFDEILWNIRKDTALQSWIKMSIWHAYFVQSQCILQNTAQNFIITALEHVIWLKLQL